MPVSLANSSGSGSSSVSKVTLRSLLRQASSPWFSRLAKQGSKICNKSPSCIGVGARRRQRTDAWIWVTYKEFIMLMSTKLTVDEIC
jgi:hypothetical protein